MKPAAETDCDADGEPASPLVRDFALELARAHELARGDADRERHTLSLMALERERLVDAHYSGASLGARIAALRAPARVRDMIRFAFQWAAREEQMHAVLVRGVLLGQRGLRLAIATISRHFAGLVAGWSSAVLTHASWRRAPLAKTLAWVVGKLGMIAGKVPRAARSTLAHQAFDEFCRFQIEAERTAEMAWSTLEALGGEHAATYARIAAEERRHRKIFGLLAASFHGDALDDDTTAESLEGSLAAIDRAFVPSSTHRVGRGGRVIVRAFADASAEQRLDDALVATDLLDEVAAVLPPGGTVAIKTTFMMAYDRRDRSPVVDPALIDALAGLLRARGAGDVVVLEAQNQYDQFFGGRGVVEVARYMGFDAPSYRVADATADQVPLAAERGHGQSTISREWVAADVRIAFGKMRTHPSWLAHLCLGTLESLGGRVDRMLFADRLADLGTGAMIMLDGWPCHLAILDATSAVPDGLTGVLGCRDPISPGRLYAATDPLALDLVAARHMGLVTFPRDVPIAMARDWFGDPTPRIVVDGPDTPIVGLRSPHRNDWTIFLSALAYPVYAYSSRRGALWVPRMDPAAFPHLGPEGRACWLARRLLRATFGFGRPA